MKYATKSNTEQTSKHTAARSKATTVVSQGPDAVAQRKMANAVSNSPQMVTQREVAGAIRQSPQLTALRESSNVLPVQREADSGAATNTTGLPDGLKSGIESMSGISMDNVNVHYNSPEPAKINALAHTQGPNIHVAPGQEKHVPHEAWHVVQQAQGRVKATMQMKGVGVNDDAGLEHEADVMGAKAASFSGQSQTAPETREVAHGAAAPVQCMTEEISEDMLKVMKLRALRLGAERGRGALRKLVKDAKQYNVKSSDMPEVTRAKMVEKSDKTTTGAGAYIASQVNLKEKIGDVSAYLGDKDNPKSLHKKLLEPLRDQGGHAFITTWVHKQITTEKAAGGWGNWGQDANFVAPLNEADALVAAASATGGKGIWDLEEALGIPTGSWVKGCEPDFSIYRYIVRNPDKLKVRIPSGSESGAYASYTDKNDQYHAGQWRPLGVTEGGKPEAVINAITLDQLNEYVAQGVIEIREETSLAANTKRVIEEKKKGVT